VDLIVGAVIGFESLGIPLPGEIVLVSAALLASQHDALNPLWIGVCASTGAIVGDSIGYAIGRKGGPRLFAWAGRKFPKHFGPEHIDKARGVFHRRGVWAVFFGRFVALLRILAGPLAGSLHMPYGKFLVANAAGARPGPRRGRRPRHDHRGAQADGGAPRAQEGRLDGGQVRGGRGRRGRGDGGRHDGGGRCRLAGPGRGHLEHVTRAVSRTREVGHG
jgi:membrane protein YqaA with SNARE-associated domain